MLRLFFICVFLAISLAAQDDQKQAIPIDNQVRYHYDFTGAVDYKCSTPAGRHPGFEQVTTALGPQTALRDHKTGIKWLHLACTRRVSYNQLRTRWRTEKEFAGWRYATPKELEQLFQHFVGTRDGTSDSEPIARNLAAALGGFLDVADNPENGFHRVAMDGILDLPCELNNPGRKMPSHQIFSYIALDTFYGASVKPILQGCSSDDYPSPRSGHYLVQRPSWWRRMLIALR